MCSSYTEGVHTKKNNRERYWRMYGRYTAHRQKMLGGAKQKNVRGELKGRKFGEKQRSRVAAEEDIKTIASEKK